MQSDQDSATQEFQAESEQEVQEDLAATLKIVREAKVDFARHAEELAAHIGKPLLTTIMLRMGPQLRRHHDPEDILQEAWLEISKSLHTFDDTRGVPFLSWATAIVRRILSRLHQGDQRRPQPEAAFRKVDDSDQFGVLERTAALSSPSLKAYRFEAVERLVQALEGLPPDHREALTLYYFEGMNANEVAARMNKSRQAVYMDMMRGKRALLLKLQNDAESLPGAWKPNTR